MLKMEEKGGILHITGYIPFLVVSEKKNEGRIAPVVQTRTLQYARLS